MDIHEVGYSHAAELSNIIRKSFTDVASRFGLTPANCPAHASNCQPDWIISDLNKGKKYFILENGGTPLGCICFEKLNDSVCYFGRLSVLPEHRNKGYGRRLVEHIEKLSWQLDLQRIVLGVIADHISLIRWYEMARYIKSETKTFEHLPFTVQLMYKEFTEMPGRTIEENQ